jgi:hypothetical protein
MTAIPDWDIISDAELVCAAAAADRGDRPQRRNCRTICLDGPAREPHRDNWLLVPPGCAVIPDLPSVITASGLLHRRWVMHTAENGEHVQAVQGQQGNASAALTRKRW